MNSLPPTHTFSPTHLLPPPSPTCIPHTIFAVANHLMLLQTLPFSLSLYAHSPNFYIHTHTTHTHTHLHLHTHTHTHTHTRTHSYTCTNTHTHTHSYTNTYTLTHTHTHPHTPSLTSGHPPLHHGGQDHHVRPEPPAGSSLLLPP